MRIKSLLIDSMPYSIMSILLLLLLGLPWLPLTKPLLPYCDRPCCGLGLWPFWTILSLRLTLLPPPDVLLDSPAFPPFPDVTLGLGDLYICVCSCDGLIYLTTLSGTPSNIGNFMMFSNSLFVTKGFCCFCLAAYFWKFIDVFNCSL